MMLDYIIEGFKSEMEKIALTRYAIEDHSDQAGDTQFLHRKAGSKTYEGEAEYVPPSKMNKKKRKKQKMKYLNGSTHLLGNDRVIVDGLNGDEGVNDYQTARAMLPDFTNRDFK